MAVRDGDPVFWLLLVLALLLAMVALATGCAPLIDPWTERTEVRCRGGGEPVLLAPGIYRCAGMGGSGVE